jgi:cytochrome b
MRAWHWINALLVSAQLVTILFIRIIVQHKTAVPEYQAVMAREGISLSEKQARSLTRILNERIWEWHIYIGLVLAGVWALWVVLQLLEPSPLRFSARLLAVARRYRLAPPAAKGQAGRDLFTKVTYALFYLFLTVIVITGLGLTWADDYAWLKPWKHDMEEIHNVMMYAILAFFAVHLVGVIWSELTSDRGLVSRMISGRKSGS